MDAAQAIGLEEGRPGPLGFRRSTYSLHPVENLVPQPANPLRVRRNEPQAGAARKRLAHPHALSDPERLGRCRDLPHRTVLGLRSESNRLRQQCPAITQGAKQGKTRNQNTDDHGRTYVRIRVRWLDAAFVSGRPCRWRLTAP